MTDLLAASKDAIEFIKTEMNDGHHNELIEKIFNSLLDESPDNDHPKIDVDNLTVALIEDALRFLKSSDGSESELNEPYAAFANKLEVYLYGQSSAQSA